MMVGEASPPPSLSPNAFIGFIMAVARPDKPEEDTTWELAKAQPLGQRGAERRDTERDSEESADGRKEKVKEVAVKHVGARFWEQGGDARELWGAAAAGQAGEGGEVLLPIATRLYFHNT